MEFGHLDDSLNEIDFSLPVDTLLTTKTLSENRNDGKLNIYIGASKWGEKSWKGIIYPAKVRDNEMLNIYSQNFNTVEFGATFYNSFSSEEINRWSGQVAGAPGFKFCPKFPQTITHIRRLANADEQTAKFYQSLDGFEHHLGPLLLQLSDNFSPKSFSNLKTFLETLNPAIQVSVEVRNKNWFSDTEARKELFNLLSDLHIGTVISDTTGRRDCVHMELTTTDAFIRFVGNNLHPSDYIRMNEWVERIKLWADKGLKSVWFFMHQNDEKFVPQACTYFIEQLNSKLGTSIKLPNIIKGLFE